MLEPSSFSEEARLDGIGRPAKYHLQSEAVHQSMACRACREAGERQAHMLDPMWLKAARQRQFTCSGRSADTGKPCRAKNVGMCALQGRHVQRALSAAVGVLVPSAKGAHGRCKLQVDPVAGPSRQRRQNLCSIAQQVLRQRSQELAGPGEHGRS